MQEILCIINSIIFKYGYLKYIEFYDDFIILFIGNMLKILRDFI